MQHKSNGNHIYAGNQYFWLLISLANTCDIISAVDAINRYNVLYVVYYTITFVKYV